MGLDVGSNLFPRTGLEQDSGLLSERWGQEGSIVWSHVGEVDADATIHTVTAGKVLFLSSITVSTYGSAGRVNFLDGGAGGTNKLQLEISATAAITDTTYFNTPLKFATDIYQNETNDPDAYITMTGWEEDA